MIHEQNRITGEMSIICNGLMAYSKDSDSQAISDAIIRNYLNEKQRKMTRKEELQAELVDLKAKEQKLMREAEQNKFDQHFLRKRIKLAQDELSEFPEETVNSQNADQSE